MDVIFGFIGSVFLWWLAGLIVTAIFGKGKSYIDGSGRVLGSCGRACGKAVPRLFKGTQWLTLALFGILVWIIRGIWKMFSGGSCPF